jgi:lysophospholipase L1-like esterase
LRSAASIVVALFLGGALSTFSATNRASAAASPKYLLALGDSLAAGYQPTFERSLPPVNPITGYRDVGYPNGYAAELASERGLTLVDLGCPGETTASMLGKPAMQQCANLYAQEFGTQSQLGAAESFLSQHSGQVELVTIDIGANDLEHCVSTSQVSLSCLQTNDVATMKHLAEILRSLASRIHRSDPSAQFASMNYYDPFLGLAYVPGGAEGLKLAAASLVATDIFNTQLAATFRTFHVLRADVASAFRMNTAVPLTRYSTKWLPANVVSTCKLTWMCPGQSKQVRDIHPNGAGYRTIAAAFDRVLKS